MPDFSFYQNLAADSNFVIEWRRMREYPLYEVSNTGRFRSELSHGEVENNMLSSALLYHADRGSWEQVCSWAMANRYFYNTLRTKLIVETSCLASS